MNGRCAAVEHLDRLIKPAVPLCPAQEAHALHQDLLGRRLPAEQRHRLVNERIERHILVARRLAGCEFRANRGRRKLDHFDLAPELLAQRHRIGMDRRLGGIVGRRATQRRAIWELQERIVTQSRPEQD